MRTFLTKMSSGRWGRAAVLTVILAAMAPQLGSARPSVRICRMIPPVLAVARTVRSDRGDFALVSAAACPVSPRPPPI